MFSKVNTYKALVLVIAMSALVFSSLACGSDPVVGNEEIDAAADEVQSNGRQDAANDIAGDNEKVEQLAENTLAQLDGGATCDEKLQVLWQRTGKEAKVEYLATIIKNGFCSTDHEGWAEKWEKHSEMSWDEYSSQ